MNTVKLSASCLNLSLKIIGPTVKHVTIVIGDILSAVYHVNIDIIMARKSSLTLVHSCNIVAFPESKVAFSSSSQGWHNTPQESNGPFFQDIFSSRSPVRGKTDGRDNLEWNSCDVQVNEKVPFCFVYMKLELCCICIIWSDNQRRVCCVHVS